MNEKIEINKKGNIAKCTTYNFLPNNNIQPYKYK